MFKKKNGRPLSIFPEQGAQAAQPKKVKASSRSRDALVYNEAPSEAPVEARLVTDTLETLKPRTYTPPAPRQAQPASAVLPPYVQVVVSPSDPWTEYRLVHAMAPTARLALRAHKLFEIQEKPLSPEVKLEGILRSQSPFVVDILAAYRWSEKLYIVYEFVRPTLLDICAGVHVPMSLGQAGLVTKDASLTYVTLLSLVLMSFRY